MEERKETLWGVLHSPECSSCSTAENGSCRERYGETGGKRGEADQQVRQLLWVGGEICGERGGHLSPQVSSRGCH